MVTLALIFIRTVIIIIVGWCVAWRVAKRGNATPSAFSVATMASQLTGVIFLTVLIVASVNNYHQNRADQFIAVISYLLPIV